MRSLGQRKHTLSNDNCVEQRPRIVVVDDNLAFAEQCRSMLEPEFEVVAVFLDPFFLAERMTELRPDVVVVDVSMPEMSGFETAELAKAIRPETKVILMTVAADFGFAAEAFRRGACGVVDKIRFPHELQVAVRRVIRGELHLSSFLVHDEALMNW